MSFEESTIGSFLDGVASERVTPAGGSAAAVVGATGAALCEMVCIHTLAKRPDDAGDELRDAREELAACRHHLLTLADSDAEAVDELLAALSSGPATAEAKRATGVPLAIAEACLSVVESATLVTERGTENAVPDAGTGAFLARSACQASIFTVRTNLDQISDAAFTDEMRTRTAALDESTEAAFADVLSNIGYER
ncbi:cyclodeaminase/cyclohydrolase family protein [Halogeometricum limi]|uniref:Formiminotetrahydrofolate cyclodeaminase n=1 Tax=Halogeometricum limi TaxID=555875 RepID=A0A1I6FTV7_9EURY|nr:cyclodeaminase/cyclohydrolase family protein [Halogeometricum limi]SFR33369.1 formiminotetrahydrofolate cyclodeaminase [Halogeometricum limi]